MVLAEYDVDVPHVEPLFLRVDNECHQCLHPCQPLVLRLSAPTHHLGQIVPRAEGQHTDTYLCQVQALFERLFRHTHHRTVAPGYGHHCLVPGVAHHLFQGLAFLILLGQVHEIQHYVHALLIEIEGHIRVLVRVQKLPAQLRATLRVHKQIYV